MFTNHHDAVRKAEQRLLSSPHKYFGYNITRHVAEVGGRPIAIGYRLTMLVRKLCRSA